MSKIINDVVVDVFVVNYNTAQLFGEMLSFLTDSSQGLRTNIYVVDNASSPDDQSKLKILARKMYVDLNTVNVGFGRANNQLLVKSSGDYVLLLNTDAFVSPDTLKRTLEYMSTNPSCGVLGVRLVGRDGDLQPSCRYFPNPFNIFLSKTGLSKLFPFVRLVDDMTWDHQSVRECDWVPGCYYLIRREVLNQVGLFDPRFFLYYEEVDHCRRVKKAGWKVVYFSDTQVVHIGGESAKTVGNLSGTGKQLSVLQIESELLYIRKHYGFVGLSFHLFLSIVADFLCTFKDVLKGRASDIPLRWQDTRSFWRLLYATRFATTPTR